MYRTLCGSLLMVFAAYSWAEGQLGAGLAPALGEPVQSVHSQPVFPDGRGLPPGSGTVAEGKNLYLTHCAACHGLDGDNGPNDKLVGGIGTLATPAPLKTVGSYWPLATTVFDFVRRAMPYQTPGTLTDDEVYAITAYVLFLNGITDATTQLNARTLIEIKMPNADGFVSALKEE